MKKLQVNIFGIMISNLFRSDFKRNINPETFFEKKWLKNNILELQVLLELRLLELSLWMKSTTKVKNSHILFFHVNCNIFLG